jgi:hypothetical protein
VTQLTLSRHPLVELGSLAVAGFVQIIEWKTSQPVEFEALIKDLESKTVPAGVRSTLTVDRDQPGHYVQIVEFGSYEAAMQVSQQPDIDAAAARMAELSDEPPTYVNLDLLQTWQP